MRKENKYKLEVEGYTIDGDNIICDCHIKGLTDVLREGYFQKEVPMDMFMERLHAITEHQTIEEWEREESAEYKYVDLETVINTMERRTIRYYKNDVIPDVFQTLANAIKP